MKKQKYKYLGGTLNARPESVPPTPQSSSLNFYAPEFVPPTPQRSSLNFYAPEFVPPTPQRSS